MFVEGLGSSTLCQTQKSEQNPKGKTMQKKWIGCGLAVLVLVGASSCNDDEISYESPCPDNGEFVTQDETSFCVYGLDGPITETGFRCPGTLPHRFAGSQGRVVCGEVPNIDTMRAEEIILIADRERFGVRPGPGLEPREVGNDNNSVEVDFSKVDILFVVDNSGSMCEEQANLRENIVNLIQPLVEAGIDFNLAVVTTDMQAPEESGRFQNTPDGDPGPSCSIAVNISDCPGTANNPENAPTVIRSSDANYQRPGGQADLDKLTLHLGCNLTVGTKGNGFEQGLNAARAALSRGLLESDNAGFLRPEAALGLVFVTDENDCSNDDTLDLFNGNVCEWFAEDLTEVDEYVEFFANLKGGKERVLPMGIIAPDTGVRYQPGEEVSPSCISNLGEGYSGYRYQEFINAFPANSISNICQPPFNEALMPFTENLAFAKENN